MLWPSSSKRVKVLDHVGVLGRTKASDGVPASGGRECLAVAGAVATTLLAEGNIAEHGRVLVHGRVSETNDLLAGLESLLIDAIKNTRKDGAGHGGAADGEDATVEDNDTVVAEGGDVREAAAATVVNATVIGNFAVRGREVFEAWVVLGKVAADGTGLVAGLGPDVGEAAAAGEAAGGGLSATGGAGSQLGGSDRGDVWAGRGRGRVEDSAVAGAVAAVAAGNATVAGRKDDGRAQETELHELVALALLVVNGPVLLGEAVRE